MMLTEKTTDHIIYSLMQQASLKPSAEKSRIGEVQEALKTASKRLTGKAGRPEFIALSGDFLLVVEDKASTDRQANYISGKQDALLMDEGSVTGYAENGALHYAQHIAQMTNFKKVFAFGCSGTNPDMMKIRPIFVTEHNYKIMPMVRTFNDFAPASIRDYYREKVLGGKSERAMELESILDRAKQLHEDLRNYGQLSEQEKPLVVSAILLALSCKTFKIDQLSCGEGSTKEERLSDGEKLYNAIEFHVKKEVDAMPKEKVEVLLQHFQLIKHRPLLNERHPQLGRSPLRYFSEYIQSKVLASIVNNVADDVLGRFYGEFLSYSGGDGKGLGIVLTPTHITQLMADLVDVKPEDVVFDPTCGTASFCITAMNRMLRKIDSRTDILRNEREQKKLEVKREHLFGTESNDLMFSIATTNMILRGDGKSNLMLADFLKQDVASLREHHFTVGLMNPPYSQAKNKDTQHLSELHFISHLLDCMADGGRVAVIVPQSTMVGKTKDDKAQKQYILDHHTLEGVITCNPQTFYPVGTNPVIAVFTAHQPYPAKKRCKFFDFKNDGYTLNPHLGMLDDGTHEEKVKHLLDCWHDYVDENEIHTSFMVRSTVSADDEWLHSYFYFNDDIPSEDDFRQAMADYLSFEFKMIVSGRGYLFGITENEEDHEIKYSDMVAEDFDLAAKKPYSDNKKGGKK